MVQAVRWYWCMAEALLLKLLCQVLPSLAKHYSVIAVELQAYGRTSYKPDS
jgi:hypothetical protein